MLGLAHPTDVLLLCAAVAMITMLVSVAASNLFNGWDTRLLEWFSKIAQSPKWFFGWVLLFLAWIPIRELLVQYVKGFAGDGDLIVLTILWSVAPYMVENAMKYSTARQMDALHAQSALIIEQNAHISDLSTAIRAQLDHSEERDELLHEMVAKLLDAIEQPEAK